MAESRSPRRINAVDRTIDILETLRERDGATVSELADAVDLSAGTVHTYLATLSDRGYVSQRDDEYHVGLFALPLGEYVRTHSAVYDAAKPVVDELVEETGEAAHLVVEHHGREIPLYERFGSEAVGERLYEEIKGYPRRNLHCSAAGKAMLAHATSERRESLLSDYELVERTPETTTDEATLREELEAIRDRGFARNDEEQIRGLRAVGAPIRNGGRVKAALSLSAPTSRLRGQQFASIIPERIVQAANVVEVNLQTTEPGVE